ncbi:hypothetical protein RRG08_061779 [Elysia crispata]|uniref:Uncharacterized protein n=1 Tax=Elysia crispata TaxID=231223 RepID=A0AAE1DTN9_9GAST|nr:hypothetical protein RRG08_061779 [Elysia crispata]
MTSLLDISFSSMSRDIGQAKAYQSAQALSGLVPQVRAGSTALFYGYRIQTDSRTSSVWVQLRSCAGLAFSAKEPL